MSAVAEGVLIDLGSPYTAPVTPNLRRKKSFSSPQLLTFDDDSDLSLASPMSDDERPKRNKNCSFDFDDARSWVKFQLEAKQVSIQLELTSTPAAMRRRSVSQKPVSVVKKLEQQSPVPPASANKENGCLFNRLESLERRLNNLKKDYSFQDDPLIDPPRSPLAPKNRCLQPVTPSCMIPPQLKPLIFHSKPSLMQKPATVPVKAIAGPLRVTRPTAEAASPALCRAVPPPSPMRPATPSRLPRLSLSKPIMPNFRSVPPPSPQARPVPPKILTTPSRTTAIPRLSMTPGRSLLPKPKLK